VGSIERRLVESRIFSLGEDDQHHFVSVISSCLPGHGVTLSLAVFETPPELAVMLTIVCTVTVFVFIEKVVLVVPAGTMMLLVGSGATPALLVERVTVAPLGAAGPVRVTVPVIEPPPFTVAGFRTSAAIAGARIARVAIALAPAYVPEIVAAVLADTALVLTVKVALVAP